MGFQRYRRDDHTQSRKSTLILAAAILLLATLFAVTAQAENWTVDRPRSQIQMKGFRNGEPFTVVFQSWNAEINFDPANPQGSTAVVTIDTRKTSQGDKTFKEYLVTPSWFEPGLIPYAQYRAMSFKKIRDDLYEANGIMNIYNSTRAIVMPFPVVGIPVTTTFKGNKGEFKSNFSFAIPDLGPPPPGSKAKKPFTKLTLNMVIKATKTP